MQNTVELVGKADFVHQIYAIYQCFPNLLSYVLCAPTTLSDQLKYPLIKTVLQVLILIWMLKVGIIRIYLVCCLVQFALVLLYFGVEKAE